ARLDVALKPVLGNLFETADPGLRIELLRVRKVGACLLASSLDCQVRISAELDRMRFAIAVGKRAEGFRAAIGDDQYQREAALHCVNVSDLALTLALFRKWHIAQKGIGNLFFRHLVLVSITNAISNVAGTYRQIQT